MAASRLCVAGGRSDVSAAEDLRDAVQRFLAQRDARAAKQMELSFRSVPDSIRWKLPEFSLHVGTGTVTRMRGPVAFIVEVVAGDADRPPVHGHGGHPDVRHGAGGGQDDRRAESTPGIDDVRMLRMETTSIDRPLVSGMDDLSGKRSRRIIARGSILYEDMFEDHASGPSGIAGERPGALRCRVHHDRRYRVRGWQDRRTY